MHKPITENLVVVTQKVLLENGCVADITVHTKKIKGTVPIVWVTLHGDERAAYVSGEYAVEKFGGTFLALENTTRELYGIDPNRIFAKDTLLRPIATFIEQQITQLQGSVVALHSNDPETAFSWKNPLSENARAIGQQVDANEKNFVWIAQAKQLAPDEKQYIARCFNAKGCNVVLEDGILHCDGSLSTWAAREGIPYINIEVEDGLVARQKEILSHVVVTINEDAALQKMIGIAQND